MSISDRFKRLTQRQGDATSDRVLAQYEATLQAIRVREPELRRASDARLQELVRVCRQRVRDGVPLDELLVDVFGLVREAAARTIGLRPFDVQLLGGIGLHERRIVQMQTGEGKTLAAVGPVALHALGGKGVHVLTFNDYLARRDAEWMGPIYRYLGLTVGFIQQDMGRDERHCAYQADVTYLTAKEAGFDFLRDGLIYEAAEGVQRPFHVAVVDEADSILIDEARVPLVIAGAADPVQGRQALMRTIAALLAPGEHFATDDQQRNVFLTEAGIIRAERLLGCGDLYGPDNLQTLTELNLALHAQALMRRDVDYIVRHDRVEIVDDFTGRVVEDRHWPDGLQAAIEAKEGVRRSTEGRVLGSITLQHFLRHYPHLCGMTATAQPAADEMYLFYGLELLVVPPNRSCVRVDQPDVVFTDREAKRRALLAEIDRVHCMGRPILVGTLTVEESEHLAADLRASGIACNVLNAKRDAQEARIVAQAGAVGAVTISTNMAGRGTDIRLGGAAGEDSEQVAALGGLCVIGTNRHESRRIDDQLRGRAGRQGDPGSSRFFVSLQDELLARYGLEARLPVRWRDVTQPHPIGDPAIQREVARAQRLIENQNYEIRRTLWRYSHFVEQQRKVVAERRSQVLRGTNSASVLRERCSEAYEQACDIVGAATVQDLERRLTLHAIDDVWAEHLATVAEIRDGIHLARIGGMSPINEFIKQAAVSFEGGMAEVDDRVADRFLGLEITPAGVDLEQTGLRGPSSTWTYLVNDETFWFPTVLGFLR